MLEGMIFFGTYLFCLLCICFGSLLVTRKNGEYYLYMTLDAEQRKDAEVVAVAHNYRRTMLLYFIGGTVTAAVSILIGYLASLQILYLAIWCTAAFLTIYRINKHYANRMYALKLSKGWGRPYREQYAAVDTSVSRRKKEMKASPLWFGIAIWICIGTLLWCLLYGASYKILWVMVVSNFLCTAFGILLYRSVARAKSKVYCEDSEINFRINFVQKRVWTIFCVAFTTLMTIDQTILMFCMYRHFKRIAADTSYSSARYIVELLILSIVPVVVCVGLSLWCTRSVARVKKGMTVGKKELFELEDEDTCWKNGYYYNPYDTSGLVENREGYGMTANMAGPWGTFTRVTLLATLVFCLLLAVAVLPLDFGTVRAKRTATAIELTGGFYYQETIRLADVVSVQCFEQLPKASRMWGSGMKQMALGTYSFQGYGAGKAMIFREAEFFLRVEMKDGRSIWFSVEDSAEMEECLRVLEAAVND